VEKNLQTSHRALPLYLFLHGGYQSLTRKTNTEFFPVMTQSVPLRKHMIVLVSPSSPRNRIMPGRYASRMEVTGKAD